MMDLGNWSDKKCDKCGAPYTKPRVWMGVGPAPWVPSCTCPKDNVNNAKDFEYQNQFLKLKEKIKQYEERIKQLEVALLSEREIYIKAIRAIIDDVRANPDGFSEISDINQYLFGLYTALEAIETIGNH